MATPPLQSAITGITLPVMPDQTTPCRCCGRSGTLHFGKCSACTTCNPDRHRPSPTCPTGRFHYVVLDRYLNPIGHPLTCAFEDALVALRKRVEVERRLLAIYVQREGYWWRLATASADGPRGRYSDTEALTLRASGDFVPTSLRREVVRSVWAAPAA